MKSLKIVIPVDPQAHKETAFTKTGHVYNIKESVAYKKELLSYLSKYRGEMQYEKYIKALIIFVFKRPKAMGVCMQEVLKDTQPDYDNLSKPLCDVLGAQKIFRQNKRDFLGAGVIDNDSRLCDVRCIKIYAKSGDAPHIRIYLKALSSSLLFQEDDHIKSFTDLKPELQDARARTRIEYTEQELPLVSGGSPSDSKQTEREHREEVLRECLKPRPIHLIDKNDPIKGLDSDSIDF